MGWTYVCHKCETLVFIVCHVNLCSSLVELLLSHSAVFLSYAAHLCVFSVKVREGVKMSLSLDLVPPSGHCKGCQGGPNLLWSYIPE